MSFFLIDVVAAYGRVLFCHEDISTRKIEETHIDERLKIKKTLCGVVITEQVSGSKIGVEMSKNHFLVYRKFIEETDSIIIPNCAPIYTTSSKVSYMDGISCNETSCSYFIKYYEETNVNDEYSKSFNFTLTEDFDLRDALQPSDKEPTITPLPNFPTTTKKPPIIFI